MIVYDLSLCLQGPFIFLSHFSPQNNRGGGQASSPVLAVPSPPICPAHLSVPKPAQTSLPPEAISLFPASYRCDKQTKKQSSTHFKIIKVKLRIWYVPGMKCSTWVTELPAARPLHPMFYAATMVTLLQEPRALQTRSRDTKTFGEKQGLSVPVLPADSSPKAEPRVRGAVPVIHSLRG